MDKAQARATAFLAAPTKDMRQLRTLLSELDRLPVEPAGEGALRALWGAAGVWADNAKAVLVAARSSRTRHKVGSHTAPHTARAHTRGYGFRVGV